MPINTQNIFQNDQILNFIALQGHILTKNGNVFLFRV